MKKSKKLLVSALIASLMSGTYGNVVALSLEQVEYQLSQEGISQRGNRLELANEEIAIVSDITLGGVFDVKSMEQGTVKHLYMNTTHEEPTFLVESSNRNIVKATLDDGRAVKLEAIEEGDAQVTVTVTAPYAKPTTKTFNVQVIAPEHAGTQRIEKNINANWKFKLQKDIVTPPLAGQVPNTDNFEEVSVPHSWNSEDGQDGGSNYYKGKGWYIKNITLDAAEYKDKQIYLEVNGASKISEVYVNGTKVGRHEGGYSIFRFDITDYVNMGQENVIAISVDNSVAGLTPLSGDFTVFGGLYRDVSIIATDAVHMDLESYGSTGLYVTQKGVDGVTKETKKEDVYKDGGKLTVKGSVKNSSDTEKTVSAVAAIYDADWKEVAKHEFELVAVAPNEGYDFAKELTVSNPYLWDGVDDPYLYNVVFEVKDENGEILDRERDRVGFRFYHIDPNEGFFLNGRSYPLRGVNAHQDRMNQGYAVSNQNRDEDMAMMEEIGANTIRFAHYQHDQYVYEASDERGITVWAEIPMVNGITETQAFVDSTLNNMKELVYQGYNRPSIIVWGIHNEQWPKANGSVNVVLDQLYKTTKEEDPSRYVTVATAQNQSAALSWQSDVSAWNKYFGLYESQDVRYFGTWLDQVKDYAEKTDSINVATNALGYTGSLDVPVHGNIGMSEYGVGSNILYHEENPGYRTSTTFEAYQTEEFQAQWHEIYYKAIDERPWLWGTYIWNMFEFGSDGRSEAGRKGINNKGLVSYDREVKKDVFYFYKANWSKQPTLQIASERFTTRYQDDIQVKVYSNMDEVELFVNGESVGRLTPNSINLEENADPTLVENTHLGKFVWDITLTHGENVVTAIGKKDGKVYKDTVKWDRKLFSEPAISSTVCIINDQDPNNRTLSNVPAGVMIKDYENIIKVLNNSTVEFYTNEDELITDLNTVIEVGMKIRVISEDKQNAITYTIVSVPISYKKKADASEVEKAGMEASNAVDGKESTRWSTKWPGTYPQWLVIDLGKEYHLSSASSLWYGKQDRKYKFYYEVSSDGENFTKVSEEQIGEQDEKIWFNTPFKDKDITARYVRVQVTGCESAATTCASLYELEIEGFRVESDKYKVDNTNKTIRGIQEGTSVETVKNHLNVEGNYHSIKVMDGDREVKSGIFTDKMTVVATGTDNDSVSYTAYTIGTQTMPISQGKTVWALECTEGGVTRPNEETLVDATSPSYAPAININDGDKATRWSGVLFGTSRNISKYPAQVIIDLGKEYNLNQIDITLFKGTKAFVDRYYQFKIYAGNDIDNLQTDENIIWDMSDNRYSNQKFTEGSKAVQNKTGRYIMLDVINRVSMSSETQEANVPSGYHCASVFELAVEGYCFNSTNYGMNQEDKVISDVPDQIEVADFLSELDIEGNYKAEVTLEDEVLLESGRVTEGAVLRISDSNGENAVSYEIVTEVLNTPISQDKKVTAEKVEVEGKLVSNEDAVKGDIAIQINDGKSGTRWSGVMNESRTNSYYPASINIELTTPNDTNDWYYLTGVEIDWFNSSSKRAYQYNIVANNPVGIPTGYELNNMDNTTQDHTEHWVTGKDNRIKDMTLTVTGSTNTASYIPASAYEMTVYGWRILSERIDEESSTISLGDETTMSIAKLRNGLEIKGNCTVKYIKENGTELTMQDKISIGDRVVVTDVKGNEFIYTAITGEAKPVGENVVTIQADDTVVEGDILEVTVGVRDMQEAIYAQDFTVKYDSKLFEFVGIDSVGEKNYVAYEENEGNVRVLIATEGGLSSKEDTTTLRLQAKGDLGQEQVMTPISIEEAKFGVMKENTSVVIDAKGESKVVCVTSRTQEIDKTALKAMIEEAKEISQKASIGEEVGQYPQEVKAALDQAIRVAEDIMQNSHVQADINQAVLELGQAIQTFKDSQIKEKDSDVNQDGVINVVDLALVAYYYKETPEGGRWKDAQKVDFNNDKVIDIKDLAIVARKILEDK